MPPPTITTPLAVMPAMLDHAVGAPALEVVTRVAQETRENLVVVLAGHGREPADAAGRLRQLERCPGGGQGTEDGMVELHEHLARLHLRIRDHLGHVVDRRGGGPAPPPNAPPPPLRPPTPPPPAACRHPL